jgi:hypothetical protein
MTTAATVAAFGYTTIARKRSRSLPPTWSAAKHACGGGAMFASIAKFRAFQRRHVLSAPTSAALSKPSVDRRANGWGGGRRRMPLVCRWQVSPATARLECHWQIASCDPSVAEEPQRTCAMIALQWLAMICLADVRTIRPATH